MAFPGNRGLICRKDYTTLRDSTMQTFFDLIPKNSPMVVKWNETTHDLWLRTEGKPSHIMFRGSDEYLKFGSYELGWFFLDQAEQIPENVFKMLQGRLRLRGVRHCGFITPNPPNQYHWIYKTFQKVTSDDYFSIHLSTYDNAENLPKSYIEDLEKQPPAWRKMYLEGHFGFSAEGEPVYQNFDPDVNIAKESLPIYASLPIIRSWDFGFLCPAVGFYQILGNVDRVHKLAELIGENITIDQFADRVIRFSSEHFPVKIEFEDVGDPAGEQKSDKTESTSVQIVKSKTHSSFRSQQSYIADGVNLIRRYLLLRDDGFPGFIIDPSCVITQEAYAGGYFLQPGSDLPVDKENHPYRDICDTDRYLFVNEVSVSTPKKLYRPQKKRLPFPHKKIKGVRR